MVATLVNAAWLLEHLSDADLRPVDTRWYLTEPGRGKREYLAGHIPGAAHMDVDTAMSAPKGSGPGRHPLPSAAAFAASAARAGISPSSHVIAYDAAGGMGAARLWWLLRYFGHSRVSVLDGGWQRWLAAGGGVEAHEAHVPLGSFQATPHPELVVDAEAVERLRHDPLTLLLDARATERYEGRTEPIDPRAGHIPGARSAPFSANFGEHGVYLEPEQLHARYAALGADQAGRIVCYCGSGVSAASDLLALHLAGYPDAQLYEGSWSDWSSSPHRPAAIGPEP